MTLEPANLAARIAEEQTPLPPKPPKVLTDGQIAALRCNQAFRDMHDIRLRIEAEKAESVVKANRRAA